MMAHDGATADRGGGTRFFRIFIEVFSIVAALLLFASAYIQYRLFAALDLPFFLVASTEDILLGGFSILATTLDQFLRVAFWLALPTHLVVFAGILAIAFAICRLLGWKCWWRRVFVVGVLIALLLLLRASLADSFALHGNASSVQDWVRSGFGPVDANGPLGAWSFIVRLAAWTVFALAPLALLLWLIGKREGQRPGWRDGWRDGWAFARSMGGPALVVLLLVLVAGSVPAAIYQSFSWGKGKVTDITPASALAGCEGGEVFVVWSGSKAEVLRCFDTDGERDFVVLRGEHTVIELERQNVRGSTLERIEP